MFSNVMFVKCVLFMELFKTFELFPTLKNAAGVIVFDKHRGQDITEHVHSERQNRPAG